YRKAGLTQLVAKRASMMTLRVCISGLDLRLYRKAGLTQLVAKRASMMTLRVCISGLHRFPHVVLAS
ncbi:hypothetical protein, partial [Pseudomonas reactans]